MGAPVAMDVRRCFRSSRLSWIFFSAMARDRGAAHAPGASFCARRGDTRTESLPVSSSFHAST
jgi:hypothetical protein